MNLFARFDIISYNFSIRYQLTMVHTIRCSLLKMIPFFTTDRLLIDVQVMKASNVFENFNA